MAAGELSADRDTSAIPGQICRDENRDIAPFSAKFPRAPLAAIGREFSHALLAVVAGKPETELQSALNRLIAAGLLFRQGVPPHASYLFKHALIQDAAYGTLLREPRRALHARVADLLESQFPELQITSPNY